MGRRIAVPRNDVPFLHEKQIEREADCLLGEFSEKFYPVLEPPIPVDEIVELHLQLTLELKDMKALFPFADVHGAIWFRDGKIAIDQALDPDANPNRRGRYHFTLAHEVAHWRLHRQHYLSKSIERPLLDDGTSTPDVVCRSADHKKPVEWQADRFASYFLMPRKMLFAAWTSFRGGDDGPVEMKELREQFGNRPLYHQGRPAVTDDERDSAIKNEFCRQLADQFKVSREAMKFRLEDLNLIVLIRPSMLF